MGKLGLGRVLHCISLLIPSNSCLYINSCEDEADVERNALRGSPADIMKIRDDYGNKTLAFHLEPKTVVLRVSMHCNGCARKVEKHIKKMEGVSFFEVDLEKKKVVVMGDVSPSEVLESVSKVKFAELWMVP